MNFRKLSKTFCAHESFPVAFELRILCEICFKAMKRYVEDKVHPLLIVRALRRSSGLAVEKIKELAVNAMGDGSPESRRDTLEKCASTAMSSKLVAANKDFFSKMVVDAVMAIDQDLMPLEMIGIKKVPGGALEESQLINGTYKIWQKKILKLI